MGDVIETAVNKVVGDKYCTVFTGERKYINKIKECAKLYPDEVFIQNINSDGSIVVKVPAKWFKFVKPPTKRQFTEEQRKQMAERLKKAREQKNK